MKCGISNICVERTWRNSGAAAFLMIEFLEVPLRTILLAAMIPAILHFLAVMLIVHLEAKRLGLRGLTPEELPVIFLLLKDGWFLLIPLVVLITMIVKGYTPYWAAFWGITSCLVSDNSMRWSSPPSTRP